MDDGRTCRLCIFLSIREYDLVNECQEAALTRRIAWRRSGGGVGLGPSGKQLHPATPELTAWRERPADSLQQSAEQTRKRHVISHVTYLRAVLVSGLIR